ncbi:MAG: hypothetical protein J6C07_08250 [Lachnospiraceae bacterium]|nr:hypothetical protein [Lachnospiraceae bacterium]
MTEQRRNRKKRSQSGAIAMMLTLILLMLLSTALLFLPEEKPKKKNPGTVAATVTPTEAISRVTEEEKLAVVLDVDTEVKMITVYNVEAEEQEKLVYTGATTFYDGYGIQQAASQLEKGGLYRFTINTKEEWISTACEAVDRREKPKDTSVWEKTGVDYMTIAQDKISFRGQNYRYTEGICVMSNGKQITLGDIQPTVDILTIRGVGQTIYEIVVTKGHGYISLKNHEDFVGGVITIGSTRIDTITEVSNYLVREGTYPVTVECGEYEGTETVTVARDSTAVFDVFEYGSGPIKKGWLTIHIDPLGADLYIDGVKTVYTDGVELEYGTYRFEFSEGGYVSYNATVLIDQPKQSLSVFLIEQKTEENSPDDNEDTTTDPQEPETGDTDDDTPDSGTNDNNTGENTGNTSGNDNGLSDIMTSVSVTNMGYNLNLNNAIYILGPSGAEIYLDGTYLGTAPMDFEKIIGSYVITVIRTDGGVKNFNCSETDNGEDSYYNFSWID